jgi:hypothetical protein
MKTVKVRIRGTINDEVELTLADADLPDDATDEEIEKAALESWSYTEYEDLEAKLA